MVEMFNSNKKSIFDKVNEYLTKKGHELVMSIYLSNYNGNNIYIRFDYVPKLLVYKVVWIDLNFFQMKHIEEYINMQMMTKFISTKIVEKMMKVSYDNGYHFDDTIIGDRVEILSYFKEPREYIFDRFLPLEWEELIDPLALLFSYLPRGMEVFLNEMLGKFDGNEEKFNCTKPVKFSLLQGDSTELFRPLCIEQGTKLFDEGKVTFLEKRDNRYIGIVEDPLPFLVIVEEVDEDYVLMWCNCKANYFCQHIYAVLLSIRLNKFNNFYKVKYVGKEESLLELVTLRNFYLCCGIQNDKLLLITPEGSILPVDIVHNGKNLFEVLEDDDDCSLSKALKEYKIK